MKQINIAGRGRDKISAALLARVLEYAPETGQLIWKPRDLSLIPSGRASEMRRWNSRYARQPAFTARTNSGYLSGAVMKVPLLAHIVAWALHTGDWPVAEIDHINGTRDDNRITNLRAVTQVENQRNRSIPSNNTSGRIGVSFHRRDKLWAAYIGNGRHISLGYFKSMAEAVAAREDAERSLGFHQNHGRGGA